MSYKTSTCSIVLLLIIIVLAWFAPNSNLHAQGDAQNHWATADGTLLGTTPGSTSVTATLSRLNEHGKLSGLYPNPLTFGSDYHFQGHLSITGTQFEGTLVAWTKADPSGKFYVTEDLSLTFDPINAPGRAPTLADMITLLGQPQASVTLAPVTYILWSGIQVTTYGQLPGPQTKVYMVTAATSAKQPNPSWLVDRKPWTGYPND